MIDELEVLRQARPVAGPPRAEARRAAERALTDAIADGTQVRRHRRPHLRLGLGGIAVVAGMLVVVAVVLVFVAGHGRRPGSSGALSGPELVFTARPAGPAHAVEAGVVARAAALLQQLVATLPGRVATRRRDK